MKDRSVDVPEHIRDDFEYLMNIAPPEIRDDADFQKTSLMYLKLGGEKLARQHIEVCARPFCQSFEIVKKRPDLDEGESDSDEEEEEEESEADDTDGL